MAKKPKRVKAPNRMLIPVPDWSHADDLIARVGQLQRQIARHELDAAAKIEAIKAKLAAQTAPLQERITLHVQSLEVFAAEKRGDIKGKSRSLNFGVLGWRGSSSISIKKDQTLALIKQEFAPSLRKSCIRVKEEPDKDVLAKLTDEQLAQIKARRVSKEAFFVEAYDLTAADYEGKAKG